MKYLYLTSKRYPSSKTDPFYVQSMAEAFTKVLGDDFLFVIRGKVPTELSKTNTIGIRLHHRLRRITYSFVLPYLIVKKGWSGGNHTFISYDPHLLSILIILRKIFRFKYLIVSDWHQLFDDGKDKFVSQNSDYLTCTSKRLKGLLVSICGIDPDKILVAYGGVSPEPFLEKARTSRDDLKKKLDLPTDYFLLGYVGGFRSIGLEKGLSTMVAALPYLDSNVKVVLVGGTDQYIKEYEEQAEKLGVHDRLILVKKQPFAQVVEYQVALDVLAIPYPDQHHFRDYGFPMKIWEYLSAGRPILYSNLAIMDEVLHDKGFSFTPDDPENLAHAVKKIKADYGNIESEALHNQEKVLAYTWEERVRNILEFIQK